MPAALMIFSQCLLDDTTARRSPASRQASR